jgi:hypothetical protein
VSEVDRTYRVRVIDEIPFAKGDLVVADVNKQWNRLPLGANGKILRANSAAEMGVEWGDQTVAPVTSVAGRIGDVVLAKGDVGLDNVDNTSDADKPVSTAQQAALDAKIDRMVFGTFILTAIAAGVTRYTAPFMQTVDTTADFYKIPVPAGWTARDLRVGLVGNGSGTGTVIVRNKNGDSSLRVTGMAFGPGGFTYNSNEVDSYVTLTNDFLSFKLSAAGSAIAAFSIWMVLQKQ